MEEEDEGSSRVCQVEHFPNEEDHPSFKTQSHSKGEEEEGDKVQVQNEEESVNAQLEIDDLKKEVYDKENFQEKNEQSSSPSVQPQIDDSGSSLIAGDESSGVGGEEASLPATDEAPTEPQLQINVGDSPSTANEAAPSEAPFLDDAPALLSSVDVHPIDSKEAVSSFLAEDPSIAPSVDTEEVSTVVADDSPSIVTEDTDLVVLRDASPVVAQGAPSILPEEASLMVTDDTPSKVGDAAPSMASEDAPRMVIEEEPSVIEKDPPSVVEKDTPSVVNEDTPSMFTEDMPMVAEQPPSMVAEAAHSLTPSDTTRMDFEDESSMGTDDTPSMVADAPSVVSEEASLMVTDDTPSMVADGAPSMASEDASRMVVKEEPSAIEKDPPSVVEKDTPSMVNEDSPSMVTEGTTSMIAEGAHSLTPSDTARVVIGDESSIVEKEAPSEVAEDPPSVVAEDPPSIIAEIAPSIVEKDTPSIVEKDTHSTFVEETPSVVAEDPPSVIAGFAPSMVAEGVSSVAAESTLSMVTEDAPPIVVEEAPKMAGEDLANIVAEEAPGVTAEDGSADASPMDDEDVRVTAAGEIAHMPEVDTEVEMETETEMFDIEMSMETEAVESSGSPIKKRKRGRPAKSQLVKAQMAKAQPKGTPPPRRVEEEDVCFICFDGGNLVLCDRRGCPKAYHPACVNRDEAFFRSKGRWNCGWHLCSICEKAAHYMCYTCTYSVCKGCIKDAEYLSVRGNRGFCEACMKTILLIEKNEQAQIDFNDRSSWEYLFKEYWIDLKEKESLTLDELNLAKNPLKGSHPLARKGESSEELYDANDDRGSDSDGSSEHLEVSSSKKPKARGRPKTLKVEEPPSIRHAAGEVRSLPNDAEWASKELLEFVAHMKNGDKSVVSQFDVQALLLDYIKQNNLRDPRRKSQIICDSRLESLFGKPRVGHFEMLKLLELHFLIKEDSRADDIHRTADTEANQLEGDGSTGLATKAISDKRRKSRKGGRGPQTNLDDYAAIDVHNIKLLYLPRSLMEDLLEDSDTFNDKVVGAFVRIRICGAGQKHDMYRLVRIAGTQKAAEPYKVGKRLADVVLGIQNLNKAELVSIDTISNQDFSEDECKRLRQSIKCGLISRMTVGEVQEKAMSLQAVRVSGWLEAEKLRISHLRDRASEQGRRKDLRECVEKLQLLNTPEERLRRLQEFPEVHDDPNMDPNYESEEEDEQDDRPQEKSTMSRDAGYGRKGRELISPGKGSPNDTWTGGARKGPKATTTSEPNRNLSTPSTWERSYGGHIASESGNDTHHHSNNWEKPKDMSTASIGISTQSPANPPEPTCPPNVSETDKMWHYQDPSGKIQGPFSMQQLRKWNKTGHFPVDLKIWRNTEKQEDSILLNDALAGKFQKEPPPPPPKVVNHHPVSGFSNGGPQLGNNDVRASGWASGPVAEPKRNDAWGAGSSSSNWAAPMGPGSNWAEPARPNSNWAAPQTEQSFRGGWDSSRGGNNGWGGRPSPQTPYYGQQQQQQRPISPHPRGGHSGGGRWNRGGQNWNSSRGRGGYDKRPNHMGPTGPSSWRTPGVQIPNQNPSPSPSPSNLPSPTPMSNSGAWSPVGVGGNNKTKPGWGEQQKLPGTPTPAPNVGWVQQQNLPVTPIQPGGWVQQQNLPVTPTPGGGWVQQQNFAVTPNQTGVWGQQSNTPGEVLNQDYSNPPTPTPMSAGN